MMPMRGAAIGQFGEDVAGDEDRFAHVAQLFEERFHFEASAGVEAAGGFVEDQHRRVVDERFGQAEPLLHAAGEAVDEVVALVGEVEQLEHVADDGFAAAARDLVGDGEEVQELPDLHAVVHAEVVGHVADAFADADRVARDAVAVDGAFAGGGAEQRGQEADGRAFAGAVGADEAEHLAGADLEIQVRHGDEFAVDLGEVAEFDHGEDAGFRMRGGRDLDASYSSMGRFVVGWVRNWL